MPPMLRPSASARASAEPPRSATRLVSVLCALALGACKQSSNDQGQQPAQGGSAAASAPSGSEILIGATLPLTGSEARIGGFCKEGYELAFAAGTQNGGVC